MAEIFGFLFLVAFVAIATWLIVRWTRDFADLLWMFTIRPYLVAATTLAVLGIVMVLICIIFGFSALSPTSFLAGLAISPLLAVRAANEIARCIANVGEKDELAKAASFIFSMRRREQRDAYEAPPISR